MGGFFPAAAMEKIVGDFELDFVFGWKSKGFFLNSTFCINIQEMY